RPRVWLDPVEVPPQLSRIENKRETPRLISKCVDKLATAQRRVPKTTRGPTAHEIQPAPHTTEETPVTTQIVILAAGMGSRLARSLPKPLTELSDGRTILQQQFDNIHQPFGRDVKVTIVVGYKLEHSIVAAAHDGFVDNEAYDQTNTSKSLLRAPQATKDSAVLWVNGDVVFDPEALARAGEPVARDLSFVTVNTSKVPDEEVKYTIDA